MVWVVSRMGSGWVALARVWKSAVVLCLCEM